MVKRDRFPEGYSSELIVPTMDRPCVFSNEFEGSGSSEQIDTKIMEDSHVPVTKCTGFLNEKRGECFVIPTQVIHTSKISSCERRDILARLRRELDQIQALQKRLELHRTNVVTFSSSSNIHGCTNLKNPLAVKNSKKTAMFSPVHDENSNFQRKKSCGLINKVKRSQQASAPSAASTMIMNQCETLLKRLMSHPDAHLFCTPVDDVKLNIPDYFSIIKHPMDLGSIKKKIASCSYLSPQGFLADVRLTFSNAMKYNPPNHQVHIMANTLSQFFEMRWKTIEKKISTLSNKNLPPKTRSPVESEIAKPMFIAKKRKISSTQDEAKQHHVQRVMTNQEKCKLRSELMGLMKELPSHIADFLKAHSSSLRKTIGDEIEIDDFSDESLFTLRMLLENYMKEKHRNKAKPTQHSEIELLNESGPRKSPMQLCKVNHAEVDVDLGGIEHPVSSCATVGIKNRKDHRRIKCVSPSVSDLNRSSSESGIDAVKISPPANGKLATGAVINKNKSFDIPFDRSESVSCLDQPELISQQKPAFAELVCQKDGDTKSESERNVSPTKFYRAALLKNRFADTILKAREKTLKQGEKGDPERLRREREELEKQKIKEKARLQAEAEAAKEAAEEARRRAEAEAASEAKRKRDLQREAAREALQKMERTVEINENCGFMEDLEMLRIPTDHLMSSVGETSPDLSHEGLGSLNFCGTNPLEQLGLFIKMDDEEEDGELPGLYPNKSSEDDMEEGEID